MKKKIQDTKIYKRSTGAEYKPLYHSECGKYIFCECKYKNGIILIKPFWGNHRIFN